MASRQSKLVFGLAGVVLLVILGVIAIVIANSQSSDRADIEERFSRRPAGERRAHQCALLRDLHHSEAAAAPRPPLRRTTSSPRTSLTDETRAGQQRLQGDARQPGQRARRVVGRASRRRLGAEVEPDYVQAVLDGKQPVALTDFIDLGDGEPAQLFAQPIETEYGRRILITGFAPGLLSAFLGQNLKELVEITGGQAYILDSAGAVVASSDLTLDAGSPVPVDGLTEAIGDTHVGPLPDPASTSRRPRSRTRAGRSSRWLRRRRCSRR